MKTPPAMFGIPGWCSKLLILHVGFWSILGEKPCSVQLNVPRHSEYATVGEFFKIECPVMYCAQRPNVIWCKYSGRHCLPLETGPQQHTGWEDKDQGSVFTLHFEPVYPSDDGLYVCIMDLDSEVISSNIITLHVTERTQNVSEHHLISATITSGPPTMEERVSRTWLLYSLLPLVPLLLLLACFCLFCFLKRHQESSGTNGNKTSQNGSSPKAEVPPAVTLLPRENRTAVCEAIAGKPAAQVFWIPDGDHVTKQESHSNGTVTVRSTCHWEQNNVSAVFCFVSHQTGNQTLSIELNQVTGVTIMLHSLLIILYVKLSLLGIILLILGFVFFQKRNYFRK